MIATIDIRVNAAHPNIPLSPLYAFKGSPSNVRILNVPQRVGKWQIDAVSVTIALPDNSSTTVPAVAVCGYWVATLPSCDETGYCAGGFQITASGTDENGVAVSGYCLGVGDVTILSRDATAVSNGTRYYLHYVAEMPDNPNPGDMCYINGTLKWYDGTAWQVFATGGGPVIDVVPPSTDPADEGKAADAKATGDALAAKRDKDDLVLYKKVGVGATWTLESTQSPTAGIVTTVMGVFSDGEPAHWDFYLNGENVAGSTGAVDADSCEVQWTGTEEIGYSGIARRPFTYQPVTGDALAKTSQLPTVPVKAIKKNGTALTPDANGAVDVTVPTQPSDIGAQPAGNYAPATNIAKTALASSVQASLGKADTAVQPAALAGAVRYDLATEPTGETPYLPDSAFPIAISSDGGTQTEYTAAQVRLQAVDTDYWALVVSNDEEMYYWDYATGAPEGAISPSLTVTFGELSSAPSLTFPVHLTDRSVLKVTLNAANTVIALPALTSGKVSDFGIDMVNAYTPEVDGTPTPTAASFQLYGTLGTDYNLIVPKGETWSDMTALAAGEMAVYYFTLSAFQIGNLPTWEVVKKVVELVPVPAAP